MENIMCFTHDLICRQPWSGWTEKPEGAIRQLVVCGVFFCSYFLTIFVPLFSSQLLFRQSKIPSVFVSLMETLKFSFVFLLFRPCELFFSFQLPYYKPHKLEIGCGFVSYWFLHIQILGFNNWFIYSADATTHKPANVSDPLWYRRGFWRRLSRFVLFFCTPLLLQEDSSDLKCQLHFAKEESALMCKKLTKLVKDGEAMKEELAKYRSLYGDVDATLTVEEVRTRERRSARTTSAGFLEIVGFALMCLMRY